MASGGDRRKQAPAPVSSRKPPRQRKRRLAATLQDTCERILGRHVPWAAVVVVLLTPIMSLQECGLPSPSYEVGEVAQATIKAPYDLEIVDERATLQRREAERENVPPVYDFVVNLAAQQRAKMVQLFDDGRRAMAGLPPAGDTAQRREATAALAKELERQVGSEPARLLVARAFSTGLEEAVLAIHSDIMQGRIVDERDRLPSSGAIAVREVRPGGTVESSFTRIEQTRDLADAREAVRRRVGTQFPDWSEKDRRALSGLVDSFVVANLSYNASETEMRRAKAMASVPQVFLRIPRGRVIVREGEIFTQEALDILSSIQKSGSQTIDWRALAGNGILLTLLVVFLYRYIQAHQRIFRRVKNLYTLVLMVVFFVGLMTWIGAFIADAVADRLQVSPFNEPDAYYWAIPVSAGAMLLTLLANGRVATVASASAAVVYGMVLGWNAQAMIFAMISSFAAIYGISTYQKRTAILKASVWVGLVNASVVFALKCVQNGFNPAAAGVYEMAMAGLGGVLAAPVVSVILPMLEWLFNVLTDIRLLELSNLDNPLLRRLSLEAPGTYNHSIIVGTLAEQAAEDIAAHALLCRVAAYYHDIGKMLKPEYFVENMRDGVNRHDKLSPRMSSLIIASHVKEGLRLAEEYNLPRQIRDIIPQHHGTRLITYFYRKAKRREDPNIPQIQETDYRYPGPRPQTKEAAIFMMADSVEAAARSVDIPTPAKFEEVINKVTNAIMLDHQFDECDLTFSDLEKIRSSFLKTLSAVHHHRISYPGFVFDRSRPRIAEAE